MYESAVVTPFAGVWIEIRMVLNFIKTTVVTPFAGVWIEMMQYPLKQACSPSLPSRECGLKLIQSSLIDSPSTVTPFAGVWIEIFLVLLKRDCSSSIE